MAFDPAARRTDVEGCLGLVQERAVGDAAAELAVDGFMPQRVAFRIEPVSTLAAALRTADVTEDDIPGSKPGQPLS